MLAMTKQQRQEPGMLDNEAYKVVIVVEAARRSGQPVATRMASVSSVADTEDGFGLGRFGLGRGM